MNELLRDMRSIKTRIAQIQKNSPITEETKDSLKKVKNALGLLSGVIDRRGIEPRGEKFPEPIKMALINILQKEGTLIANDLVELTILIQEIRLQTGLN